MDANGPSWKRPIAYPFFSAHNGSHGKRLPALGLEIPLAPST